MGGWTGIGKDRINWDGTISQRDNPSQDGDLSTKSYVDDVSITEVNTLPLIAREGKVVYLKPNKRLYLNIST